MYMYSATVIRWIDGDTVDLEVDLGFRMSFRDRFRLYGIDTPELRPRKANFPSEEERRKEISRADAALAYCEKKAPAESKVIIKTHKDSRGKYGRWLAEVHPPNEQITLNELLVKEGHAKLASY